MFLVEFATDAPFIASETERQCQYDAQWPPLKPKFTMETSPNVIEAVSPSPEQIQSENTSGTGLHVKPGLWEKHKLLIPKNAPPKPVLTLKQWTVDHSSFKTWVNYNKHLSISYVKMPQMSPVVPVPPFEPVSPIQFPYSFS